MSDEQTHGRRQGRSSGAAWEEIVEPETATSATRRLTRRELREAEARAAAQQGAQGGEPLPGARAGTGRAHAPGAHTAGVPQVQQPVLPPATRSPWSPVLPQDGDQGAATTLPPARPRWSTAPAAGRSEPSAPAVQPAAATTDVSQPHAWQAQVEQPPVSQPPVSQPPAARPVLDQPPVARTAVAPTVEAGVPAAHSWASLGVEEVPTAAAQRTQTEPPLALALLGDDDGAAAPSTPEHHGHPHRRRHRVRSLLVLAVALAMVLGAGYVVWTLFKPASTTSSVQDYPGPGGPSVQVVINSGDTGADMAKTLYDAGVVATTSAFTKAYSANPDAGSIQPGTYNLLLQMKASDAVTALLDPTNKASLKVTIPEGLTAAQILQKVSEKTTIPLADLQAAAADPTAIGLPDQAGGKVEGWLYPATYEVDPTSTAASVLSQMVAKTLEVLAAKGVAADQQEAVLIKASLIEKEASRDEDRPKMARVIENRLDKNMPLQIDTATAYGLNKSAMDLTVDELADTSNPYNLRVLTGLPPTPISSPGEASIDAVLAPADGDWLFWVTVNLDTGETVFTDNYADFQVAKQQYLDWEAANSTATATP